MHYILCPCCDSCVEVPSQVSDSNGYRCSIVVVCPLCDTAFDGDEYEIHADEEEEAC